MPMASLGGGAIIAFAAVLWLLYLTPTWLRRREYLRTERTAVRLQQTLRVLAETAEVPDEVRAEVSARSVAEQHRALRESARRAESVARPREARAERTLARSGSGPREPRSRALAVSDIAAARLRRSRVLATNILVAGITLTGWGVSDVSAGGTWEFLVAGLVVSFLAVALLQRASTVAAAHRAVSAVDQAVVVPEESRSFSEWQEAEPSRPTWTPVPLPKPRYLDQQKAVAPTVAGPRRRRDRRLPPRRGPAGGRRAPRRARRSGGGRAEPPPGGRGRRHERERPGHHGPRRRPAPPPHRVSTFHRSGPFRRHAVRLPRGGGVLRNGPDPCEVRGR